MIQEDFEKLKEALSTVDRANKFFHNTLSKHGKDLGHYDYDYSNFQVVEVNEAEGLVVLEAAEIQWDSVEMVKLLLPLQFFLYNSAWWIKKREETRLEDEKKALAKQKADEKKAKAKALKEAKAELEAREQLERIRKNHPELF